MPSVEFSGVAIGGKKSWRSEEMDKIKKANKSDVITILRFNLPYCLFRLPDGSYYLKEGKYTYRFVIKKMVRNPKIAKELTGWTPEGNINIISDRFGRFLYSKVEIEIPYRIINDEMWDYFCPNCMLEVNKNTTNCPACNAEFTSEKSRRPPLTEAKIKAIEIVNKFLDSYRFFFKEYYVEHIRYNDITSYEIEYKLSNGTTASWQEAFSLSYDGSVRTASLTANKESVEKFRDFLSKPEKRIILRDYLLSSSENRISTEEYHLAILDAVIALEITLYDYIMKKMINLELPKDKNKAFLLYIGAFGNLKVILRLLTKGEEQLSDKVYDECAKAITKRNKIMHEAKTDATYGEAKKILCNVNTMIEYVSMLKDN